MKKLFVTMAIVCSAMMFNSCKEEKACWEVVARWDFVDGRSSETTTYVYGSEDDVDIAIKEIKKAANSEIDEATLTFTKKKVDKSKSDCKD